MELARLCYRTFRLAAAGLRFHLAPLIGVKPRFEIDSGYNHRKSIRYYDDTTNTDDWQREVYENAHALMLEKQLRTVHDVGCGSGYKLVHMLGEFETTGIDLPDTIAHVRQKYPDRSWIGESFENVRLPPADLVICSDVIEHVQDPDGLMNFIISLSREWVVLSTPARELLYDDRQRRRFGPPSNPAHVREWSMIEFQRYAARYLNIVRHEITNWEQGTQMIIGRKLA